MAGNSMPVDGGGGSHGQLKAQGHELLERQKINEDMRN